MFCHETRTRGVTDAGTLYLPYLAVIGSRRWTSSPMCRAGWFPSRSNTVTSTPARAISMTDSSGEKVAVVLPLQEYDALMKDLQDLAVIAERRDEPRVSLEEVKQRLKSDGLLPD